MIEAQEASAIDLTEPLTWAEICRRYPDRWVALVEMDWDDETDEFTMARSRPRRHPRPAVRRCAARAFAFLIRFVVSER
jgi:hypothetical protein